MSLVGAPVGRYARPSCSSELINDHVLAAPLYDHESSSHVSLPTSPGRGIGLNVQRRRPVRTSIAWTMPGASASLRLGESDIALPMMTTSLQTCGELVIAKPVALGPTAGRRSTRPFVPKVRMILPVFGSSAVRYWPRTVSRRASAPRETTSVGPTAPQ